MCEWVDDSEMIGNRNGVHLIIGYLIFSLILKQIIFTNLAHSKIIKIATNIIGTLHNKSMFNTTKHPIVKSTIRRYRIDSLLIRYNFLYIVNPVQLGPVVE